MNVRPSLPEVLAIAGDPTHVALTVELSADTETPISLYAKLAGDRPGSFLLESAEGGEVVGRYSFIGFDIARRLVFRAGRAERILGETRTVLDDVHDPLEMIRRELGAMNVVPDPRLPRFQGGAVGYLGFETFATFEPAVSTPRPPLPLADAELLFADELAIYDHLRQRLVLVTHVPLAGDREASYRIGTARLQALVDRLAAPSPPPLPLDADGIALPAARSASSPTEFVAAVGEAKAAIAAGEIFQVVLSRRQVVDLAIDPFVLYRALRSLSPSPYMFYLRLDPVAVVGASPEVLVRLEGERVLVRPIAGTRRRGANAAEDQALAEELLADEKELAEHRMLVDLGRNDVGRVARLGTVRVERPLHIERYSHVMHIVTDVEAELRPGLDAFDVFRACFPAGTVSGAPKIRAVEILTRLEPERRGVYAGAVGYFDLAGNLDTCIAIRTMVVEPRQVWVQSGAGIVFDSIPERELEECDNKAKSALTAIAIAARAGREARS